MNDMDVGLASERLRQVDAHRQTHVSRGVRHENGGVLEIVGADTADHRPPDRAS